MFLVATLLPAIALAWLGWQLIAQDRRLERQRVQDFVESTALVTTALEREPGSALRRNAMSRDTAITVRLSRDGRATSREGPALVFETISRCFHKLVMTRDFWW